MSPRPLNLLLLLSAEQKPSPEEEATELNEQASHAKNRTRSVWFATTRKPALLESGSSQIILYGDENLDHMLLATGTFGEFVQLGTPKWDLILRQHESYRFGRLPETVRGFLRIDHFVLASGEDPCTLKGIVESGASLNRKLLAQLQSADGPFGREGSAVYFVASTAGTLTPGEQVRLLQAKRVELADKVSQYAGLWQSAKARAQQMPGLLWEAGSSGTSRPTAPLGSSAEKSEDKVDRRPKGERAQLARRLKLLTESAFKRLVFQRDSLDALVNEYANLDIAWELLSAAATNGFVPAGPWQVKRFAGTQHWREVRPKAGTLRVYVRSSPRDPSKLWVLVSEKELQEGSDTNFMRRNDHRTS